MVLRRMLLLGGLWDMEGDQQESDTVGDERESLV